MGKIVKYCAACEEGFAEKFAFCPNCGNALTAFEMNPLIVDKPASEAEHTRNLETETFTPVSAETRAEETSPVTPEAYASSSNGAGDEAREEKILDDEYLAEETAAFNTSNEVNTTNEVANEVAKFDDRAYRTDYRPQEYSHTAADDGYHITVIEERNTGARNALLLGSWLLVMTLTLGGVVWSLFSKELFAAEIGGSEMLAAVIVDETPMDVEVEKEPEQKKKDDAGGGGGGGRDEPDPVSKGRLAPQTEKPLITPTKTIPQMDTELKMQAFTQGPERPVKVTNENYGDPNSKSYKLSDGTGTGGGQGSGIGSGQGSGVGTGAGSGRGSGMGSGIGSGIGGGTGAGNQRDGDDDPPPVKPVGPTEGVKILSKPRANYTDAARQQNIQGVVRLRVTFNANGTIGGITPVSSLGAGLTEQAIAAARSIRFEPAKRGGVPYSVTKVVEYTFTLY